MFLLKNQEKVVENKQMMKCKSKQLQNAALE